jgi:hypothetical protein
MPEWRPSDDAGKPVTDLAAATVKAVTLACGLGTTADARSVVTTSVVPPAAND